MHAIKEEQVEQSLNYASVEYNRYTNTSTNPDDLDMQL